MSSACSGRNGVGAGGRRFVVRRPVHGRVDGRERVGRADRPVAARDQAGARAVQVAEGVLPGRPLLAEERDGQLGHLVVEAGPQGLDVGRDAERREARHVVGVHQLQVGDVVAARGVGALEGVERLAHAPVAEAVDVDLEAVAVELADVRAQLDRVDERDAGVVGGVPAAVEVGLDEGSGAVLGDAVLHDLHRARREPAASTRRPASRGARRSARRPGRAPTTAHHDGAGEVAGGRSAGVRRADVAHAGVAPDDRVLPARDAERVEVPLPLQQAGVHRVVVDRGQHVAEQRHRALVQHARRGRRRRRAPRGRQQGRAWSR